MEMAHPYDQGMYLKSRIDLSWWFQEPGSSAQNTDPVIEMKTDTVHTDEIVRFLNKVWFWTFVMMLSNFS